MSRSRRFFVLCSALLLLLLVCICSGCGGEAPQLTVTADNYERELYRDDTAIGLTVITPANCTELTVWQLGCSYEIVACWGKETPEAIDKKRSEDPFFCTEPYRSLCFTADSADVSTDDSGMVWHVTADFGADGVYGLLISATLDNGKVVEQKVPVYVRYPEINIVDEGVAAGWEAYILRNSSEPFYFICDLNKTSVNPVYRELSIEMRSAYGFYNGTNATRCFYEEGTPEYYEELFGHAPENPWDIKFTSGSPVYGEFVLFDRTIPLAVPLSSCGFPGEMYGCYPPIEMCFPTGDVIFCRIIETDTTNLSAEVRAAVSYLNDASIDATLYPDAARCLEMGAAALSECLTPGMTDFEKVKAIHDWMLETGRDADPSLLNAFTLERKLDYLQTARGFANGYGGDCMGWSHTFYMLCSMAGIPCSPVSSLAEPGGPVERLEKVNHSFNVAQLDGEIYYFDVYWDGAGSGFTSPPYSHFCMTTEEAAKSHIWAAPERHGPPEAVSTTYAVDPETGELLNG